MARFLCDLYLNDPIMIIIVWISRQNEDGTFNFNENTVIPDTEANVKSWYKPGETWDIIFQEIASTYEECRAECVGLYLCLNNKVLR